MSPRDGLHDPGLTPTLLSVPRPKSHKSLSQSRPSPPNLVSGLLIVNRVRPTGVMGFGTASPTEAAILLVPNHGPPVVSRWRRRRLEPHPPDPLTILPRPPPWQQII